MVDAVLSRFIKGVIATGLGNLSNLTLGLITTMIIARRLPAEDYGIFVLLTVTAGLLVQVSSLGLDLALSRFVVGTEDAERKRKIVNSAIWFRLATSVLISVIIFMCRSIFVTLFGASFLVIASYTCILFVFQSMTVVLKGAVQGFYGFKALGMADFIAGVANFVLVVVLVLIFQEGFLGLIYAKIASIVLMCVYLYVSIPVKRRFEVDRTMIKDMLRFGWPLQVNDILDVLYNRIDTLIIGMTLGPANIAYYEMARNIPDSLHYVYDSFRVVFFPFISKYLALGEREKAARLVNNCTRIVSFVMVFGTLIALLFGTDVIKLFFSAKYLPSVPAFCILLITLSVALVGNVLGTSLVAAGETNKPAIINSIQFVISLCSTLILVVPLGIVGVALSRLIGTAVANPLNLLFLRKKVHARPGFYLNSFLVFGLCGLLVLLFQPVQVLAKTAIALVFIIGCWYRNVFTRRDLVLLVQQLRLAVAKPL